MPDVVWRPNNDITRMHATAWKLGETVGPALCGFWVSSSVHLIGAPPARCKRCERKVQHGG